MRTMPIVNLIDLLRLQHNGRAMLSMVPTASSAALTTPKPERPPILGRGWSSMQETAISLMAIAETRKNGYVDVPPSELSPEVYEELIRCGHCVSRSDALWKEGWRVYSPRAVRAGFFEPHISRSIYTRIASPEDRVPTLAVVEAMRQTEIADDEVCEIWDKASKS